MCICSYFELSCFVRGFSRIRIKKDCRGPLSSLPEALERENTSKAIALVELRLDVGGEGDGECDGVVTLDSLFDKFDWIFFWSLGWVKWFIGRPIMSTFNKKYKFGDIYQISYLRKPNKQAGAELCQAQVKLWLAKVEIFFPLIEN